MRGFLLTEKIQKITEEKSKEYVLFIIPLNLSLMINTSYANYWS